MSRRHWLQAGAAAALSAAVWPALAGGVARLPILWITATGGVTLTAAAAAGWLATAAVKTGFARPAARTVLSRPCTSP